MDQNQQARVEARMKMDRSCLRVDGCEQGWSPEKLSQARHPCWPVRRDLPMDMGDPVALWCRVL